MLVKELLDRGKYQKSIPVWRGYQLARSIWRCAVFGIVTWRLGFVLKVLLEGGFD
jgi:hypothetical protein